MDEATGGWQTEATGWPRVANHAALHVFRAGGDGEGGGGGGGGDGRGGANASAAAAAGALRCTLRAGEALSLSLALTRTPTLSPTRTLARTTPLGEALFLPALWSHAVASLPQAEGGATGAAVGGGGGNGGEGLNAAANLWFVRGAQSFEAALTARPLP